MRYAVFTAVLGLAASAAFAGGATADTQRSATQCLDMTGAPHGAVCRQGDIWRQSDICRCPGATMEVTVPYCAPGETPAPDSLGANRARMDAARHGTLGSASYEGKRFCARPTRTPR